LFLDNNIEYPKGIHEDIPVTYLLFWYADKIHVSDEISYYWVKRNSSITSYISKEHIDGWFGAIDKQREFVKENFNNEQLKELNRKVHEGFLNAADILLSNIYKYENKDINQRIFLYKYLFNKIVAQTRQIEHKRLKNFVEFVQKNRFNKNDIDKLEVQIQKIE
jgi:hypothetical protein